MEKIRVFKLMLICLLFTSFTCLIYPNTSFSQETLKINIPFSKISPIQTTTLMGASNHIKVKIPVPERWQVKKAVLNFSYINSTALLQSRSRLVVWLNEHPIAQITLNPQLPEGKVAVNLPINLLKAGYNDLMFTVSHHYTLECEDPSASELWTTVELDKASFNFEVALKRVPDELSSIANFLFDPKKFGENEINIVISDNKEETLELASIVASAIALRFEYRPLKFTVSQGIKKGVDNVILGNEEFIKKIIELGHLEKGPYLTIKTLTEDPFHALIIIKGDNLEDLKKAVYAFASINFPFPKAKIMKIENVQISPEKPKTGKGIVFPGYEYSFNDLGFFTTNFKGIGAKSVSMDFKMPSDVFLMPNSFVSLKLNFSYGSGMRKDSTLNIQINGKYVASIHLDNVKGGFIKNYMIDIPLSLFKPGYNVISFTAVLSPLITDYCEFIQTENLQLTIFDDSKIAIPRAKYWASLPNLNLFFIDGYPFSKPSDFNNTGVLIAENTSETISSAINLVALSAQRAGYIPFKIKFSFDKEKIKDRNIIVAGSFAKIPEKYLQAGNLKLEGGSFTYQLAKHFEQGESTLNAKLRSIIEKFITISKFKTDAVYSKSHIKFSGETHGNWVALSEFESPHKGRHTVLVITSPNKEELLKGVYALWEPSIGAKATGSLMVFDASSPEDTLSTYRTDKAYYVGKLGIFTSITAWIYAHPVIFTVFMLILIIILAYFIYRLIKKFREERVAKAKN